MIDVTDDLNNKRKEFYQDLAKILNRIASDEDRIVWIQEKLDPLLEDCFWQGFDSSDYQNYHEGYQQGYSDCKQGKECEP